MPTLDALKLRGPESSGTDTDWPIVATIVFCTDENAPTERPTSNESFHFDAVPYVEADSMRVRRAVRRAVSEFGPAFDRLGDA